MRSWLVLSLATGCYWNMQGPGKDPEVDPDFPRTPDLPAECDGERVRCVDDDSPEPRELGTSDRPFHSIAAALEGAESGDLVQVAAGTYAENVALRGLSVQLLGGFPGGSDFGSRDPVAWPTVLKGLGDDATVTLVDSATLLDGFVITGGTGHFDGDRYEGGGIHIDGGRPTLSHNVIEDNDIRHGAPDVTLTRGGGVSSAGADVWIIGNTIRWNRAGRGAGISAAGPSTLIRDNVIEDNIANHDHGGGIFASGPNVEISGNRISRNEIGRELGFGWGGGVYLHDVTTYARMSHNLISENFAPSLGSGVFVDNQGVALFAHELYVGNVCPERGGAAVYVDGLDNTGATPSFVQLDHVTIADHHCQNELGGNAVLVEGSSQATIENSILWGNGGEVWAAEDSSLTATFTLSTDPLPGEGNLSLDPLFGDGYHPRSMTGRLDPASRTWVADPVHSPAIDAADPTARWQDEPAPNGARANLGFDGGGPEASQSR
jgi:hypothetical protein